MTQKTNPWTFDVRVRERNLKAGGLTEKDVEKYLSTLPDLADQAEPFATAQPALEQPEIEEPADDEDDEVDEAEEPEAAAESVSEEPAPGGDVPGT